MSERKLATIRRISKIQPIEGADAIELAIVDGWQSVVKKGEYKEGDKIIFCEIDSWVPHGIAPFLSKGKEPREFNGVKGERLGTMKLRGVLSQGLILPTSLRDVNHGLVIGALFDVGDDVTEHIGIQKWERPIPANLAGLVKGNFPSFVPKTDQERVQNLVKEIETMSSWDVHFEVTEKLDGSSMTVFLHQGEFGVCSRNLQLQIEGNENNAFVKTAIRLGIEDKLRSTSEADGLALQGELVGEGVQGNPYKLKGLHFYVYNVFDIEAGKYVSPMIAKNWVEVLGLNYVPVLENFSTIGKDVESILNIAEGKSILNPSVEREGLVFKRVDGTFSFKAISNRWLLGGSD